MGEDEGGRRLRLRPSFRLGESSSSERGAHAPEGEPLARRVVNKKVLSPLPFTLLDRPFYVTLLEKTTYLTG